MVASLSLAGATTLELAGAGNLRPWENYVLPGFWAEGFVRVGSWEDNP